MDRIKELCARYKMNKYNQKQRNRKKKIHKKFEDKILTAKRKNKIKPLKLGRVFTHYSY